MMVSLHGITADEARLKHAFGDEPFSAEKLLLAAKSLTMSAKLIIQPPERLDRARCQPSPWTTRVVFFILARYGQAGNNPPGGTTS